MNIEQRLVEALRNADRIEPSPDLWSRVVHSIEEDRQHRRRVMGTGAAIAATTAVLVAVGAASLGEGRFGRFVHRPTMEALELVALVILVLVLGPAIRRFGRHYVHDLWPAGRTTPSALLGLLDLAYYLVFVGYILSTTEFRFADARTKNVLAPQMAEATDRIGALLLLMGLLHAVTIMVLPAVALIDNSTRSLRPLPRWLALGGVVVALGTAVFLLPVVLGLIVVGQS